MWSFIRSDRLYLHAARIVFAIQLDAGNYEMSQGEDADVVK